MGARFVRLGIAGFKSFADATTLDILPGLTGIVGPNGCGKSNIAEALRWAMGEPNARHLRGGEMDDVIFAGAAHRPSRNLAEVTLTLEDDDQGMPPPFAGQPELQVSRQIERGSGSSYRVNGRESRARDVQTLFADLASGARSSAMVSQGRVSQLVSARPDERRAVLEEAAGITGLHARRQEAETRLKAAEGNLERAEERRGGLERQLNALDGQAREAARYRRLSEELLAVEALVLAIQRTRAVLAVEAAVHAVESGREQVRVMREQHARAASQAEALQAALPGLRDREAECRSRAERARMAQEALAAETGRAAAALAVAEVRHAQLQRDQAHAERAVSDAEAADVRLMDERELLRTRASAYPAALLAAETEAAAATEAVRAADEAESASSMAAATAVAQADLAERLLRDAETRSVRAEAMLARSASERDRAAERVIAPARIQDARATLAASRAAAADACQAEAEAEQCRLAMVRAGDGARGTHSRADAVQHKLAVECGALAEVLAVRDGERWPPMIDSVVVPPGLEAALGAVLGEELAAAGNLDASRHWRALPAREAAPVPGRRFAQLASGPALLSRALGAIGLVESDAQGAATQPNLAAGQSVVTCEGAVWRWDGYTVRAGTPTAAAVRLRQRNRLAELTRQHAAAAAAADAALQHRIDADARERAAVSRETTARQARREGELIAERARTALGALETEASRAELQLASLVERMKPAVAEAGAAAAALRTALASQQDRAALDRLREAATAARAAVTQARQRETAAGRSLQSLQVAAEGARVRADTIVREREDRRMRAHDLRDRVTDLAARATETEAELRGLRARPDHAGAQAAAREAELLATEALAQAVLELGRADQAVATAIVQARAAEVGVYDARERLARAEAASEACEEALKLTEARIADRAGALPPLPATAESTAAAEERRRFRLNQLARERDGIGPVNLRAELETETIRAEIAAIVRDRAELHTAIAKLRGSIGHLNREGRERLQAVFQQVDRNFQTLFGKLFGGGRAHLALVGSEDPLEAGLEIFAQPPGKTLTALSLLSGGEQALTALSLIFAVFRCNPAPLCVLDEVDAPLDDANVGRFCSLLSEMARETGTRFLVVTHHQVTMSGMDRLYGVTMQERGVSRLVSVDLARAECLVEAIAAE